MVCLLESCVGNGAVNFAAIKLSCFSGGPVVQALLAAAIEELMDNEIGALIGGPTAAPPAMAQAQSCLAKIFIADPGKTATSASKTKRPTKLELRVAKSLAAAAGSAYALNPSRRLE